MSGKQFALLIAFLGGIAWLIWKRKDEPNAPVTASTSLGNNTASQSSQTVTPSNNYGDLAAAIMALANGVVPPIFFTANGTLSSGNTTVVLDESGKQMKVYAHTFTTDDTTGGTVRVRSGLGALLWQGFFKASATNSHGANLACSWPTFMYASSVGEGLRIDTDIPVRYSLSYWKE